MRTLTSVGLALSLVALAACEDSTGTGVVWRSEIGQIGTSGRVSVDLPGAAGTPDRLPALTCYTSHPDDRVWYAVGSVELPPGTVPPGEQDVLSNCILEPSTRNPNRLMATMEGETPGWLYQFVVVY